MNKWTSAQVLGALIAISLLPLGLLLAVGDTPPGGGKVRPDYARGIAGIIVGMMGLFLYGIGHFKIDHNKMTKGDHLKLTIPIVIGTLILVAVALLIHD